MAKKLKNKWLVRFWNHKYNFKAKKKIKKKFVVSRNNINFGEPN